MRGWRRSVRTSGSRLAVEAAKAAGAYRLRVRPVMTAELAQATVRVTVWIQGHPHVAVIVVGVR